MVRLKIAIVSNMGLDPREGGTEYYTKHLVEELERQGHDVSFACRDGDSMGRSAMPKGKMAFARAVKRFLNEKRPDGILCQGGWFTVIPSLAYKKTGVKVVYLFHSFYTKREPFYTRVLYARMMRKCDAVAFQSKGLRDNIINQLGIHPSGEGMVICPAVAQPNVSANDVNDFRSRFGIDGSCKVLLAHSLLASGAKKEGAILLVRTLSEMVRGGDDLALILTRSGPFLEEVKAFASELNIGERGVFTGNLENPNAAMAVADVYTHIAYGAGLPIAVMEAMAMGKPIIASNFGGIPELIDDGKTGILVRNDEKEIAEAIRSILDDEALGARLGANAKKGVFEKFSWEKTAKQLVEALSH